MLKTESNVQVKDRLLSEQGNGADQEGLCCYFDASANSMLDSVLAPLVQDVCAWMSATASQNNVSVLRVTVYGHVSPDEEAEQLVITQVVDLAAVEALAYRRRLFKAAGAWVQTLPLAQRSALLKNLVLNVRWNSNAT